MTFQEMFNNERRWYKRVLIIRLYHYAKLYNNRSWKIIDTAKYFHISIGQTSENLQLAQAINDRPALEQLSRNSALKEIRNHARCSEQYPAI